MRLAIGSILISAAMLAQQSGDPVVVGSVFDSSKAAVTGASVVLTHTATNAVTQVRTDEHGQYRTPPLRLGDYSISVEADGFKRSNQRGIVLDLGDVREVDVVLQVGQVSDSVSVEATAPLLQTADSTVGTVITNKQIEDLPLNGRDYLQLAILSSGTVPAGSNGVGISVGGQAGSQAAFLLDGLDNNNQQVSTGHSNQKEIVKPSVDAIAEFKVVTNSYSAEYGRSSSGVISVALKSGSNEIHGAAFEFLRNEAMDARNFFAPVRSPYKRNQYGTAIGGPIKRNKTFVFGDFEIAAIRQSTTNVSTVPSASQRSGLFSTAIIDPTTGTAFPGNRIPVSRFDTGAANVVNFYPGALTAAATNNYVYASPTDQDNHRYDFRVDQILSDRQNAYFRYSEQTSNAAVTAALPPVSGNYIAGGGANVTNSRSFVLVYNRVWSPSIVSSVRAGWNDLAWVNTFPNQSLTGVGIPGVLGSNPGFSQISVTGLPAIGVTNVPNSDASQNRQLSGDLTWNKGSHNIKFGGQAWWLQTNFFSSQQTGGLFAFNGQYTKNAFADFLLGDASSASLSDWAYLRFRAPYTHFFVQDDWKISRHLTLNIGLRYELSPPAIEKQNKIANFDMDSTPGHPQLVLAASQGSGVADRALQGFSLNNLAPRFGFAYSLPDNKTVVRGGYGIFYSNLITLGGMQSMEINPPNHLRINLTTSASVPSIFLDQGFAANTLTLANAQNVELLSYDRSTSTPTAQQWNLDIQRELPGGMLLEAGYYGNHFDHMWRQIDGNPAAALTGNINSNRLYTTAAVPGTPYTISLADVVRIQKDGYSRYNALHTKLEKRYSHGLTFIASYAYSKTMSLGDTAGVQNPANWAADRAVSAQDMTQHFVGSAVYALPFGAGRTFGSHWNRVTNAFFGGWSVGPIVTANTGLPLSLTVNGNPSNTGQIDRPNVVGTWQLANPTVQEWFNTAAFVANAKYAFGNAGRNILRGPGVVNLDLAAHKSFRITERVTAQLRFESFNATNTPAFGNPNTQVGNPSFGQISAAGTPRDNQAALKVIF